MGPELIVGLGIASAAATAGSAVLGYVGAQQQAKAVRQQGEYNAQVLNNEAQAAQQQAAYDAQRQRDKIARLQGTQTANLNKSGAGGNEDLLFDTAVQGELDALNIEYKGKLASNRYLTQADMARTSANNQASSMSGIGSLIGGFARAGSQAYDVFGKDATSQNPVF